MRRLLVFLVSLSVVPLFLSRPAYGQTSPIQGLTGGQEVPGLTCGLAGGENGTDKCCSTKVQPLPGIPFESVIDKIPFVGRFIDLKREQGKRLEQIQKLTLQECAYGVPSVPSGSSCRCIITQGNPRLTELCAKYLQRSSGELQTCINCTTGGGMWTGLGCIPLTVSSFVTNFALSFGVSLAFIVALICVIYSAFILQTSAGNPDRIKKAREYLNSCIIGLLLILFSVLILRLIGVNILGIPFLS